MICSTFIAQIIGYQIFALPYMKNQLKCKIKKKKSWEFWRAISLGYDHKMLSLMKLKFGWERADFLVLRILSTAVFKYCGF